jgi:hypothetical protein
VKLAFLASMEKTTTTLKLTTILTIAKIVESSLTIHSKGRTYVVIAKQIKGKLANLTATVVIRGNIKRMILAKTVQMAGTRKILTALNVRNVHGVILA